MILNAEDRFVPVAHAFDGAVVEIDMGDLDVGGQGGGIDGEAVVLGGDGHFATAKVLHRLVAAAMAEFELEGLSAECVPENLVTEANGKDGFLAGRLRQGSWRGPRWLLWLKERHPPGSPAGGGA